MASAAARGAARPDFSERGFAQAARIAVPVSKLIWLLLFALTLAAPAIAALALAAPGPAAHDSTAAALSPEARGWLLYALNLVPLVFLAVAATILFWRRVGDPVAALLSYGYLASGAALHFAEGLGAGEPALETARLGLEVVGIACLTVGMLLFPSGRFVPRWTGWALPPLLIWGGGRMFHLFSPPVDMLLSIAFMLFSISAILLRYRRLAPGVERQQIRWALFGFAVGLALNMVSLLLFWRLSLPLEETQALWTWIVARALNALFMVGTALGLLVSVLRYRLYDADAVISRSAGFAALTVALVALFAATEKLVEAVGQGWFPGLAGPVAGGVAASLVAVSIAPLHNRAQAWAESRFQKGLVRLRRDLPVCVGDMRETAPLPVLLREILDRVSDGVRASRAALLIDGAPAAALAVPEEEIAAWLVDHRLDASSRGLDCDRSDPLFPVRLPLRAAYADGDGPAAWLLLGPRPDGTMFRKDDRAALAEIADPVARAIATVRLRETREEEMRRRDDEQDRRMAALEARVVAALERLAGRPGGAAA
jgi:hypothetical protein